MSTKSELLLKTRYRWIGWPISFGSFWLAIIAQPWIAKFLAKYITQAYLLNGSTILIMWLLAMYILPIAIATILAYIIFRNQ